MQTLCRLSCGGRALAYPDLCSVNCQEETSRESTGKDKQEFSLRKEGGRGKELKQERWFRNPPGEETSSFSKPRLCRTREARRGSQDSGGKWTNLTRSPKFPVRDSRGRQSPNAGVTSRTRGRTDQKRDSKAKKGCAMENESGKKIVNKILNFI